MPRRKGLWAQTACQGRLEWVHRECKQRLRDATPIPGWLVPIYGERWAT